ncbi:unnamed protein product [Allacma fusca]|uniref:Uncharacterized protein n=1 Tax=Allacma fusca TaxID=39272 RepID=A0A8J2L8N6_9HEXA|nr:unnamed protein product [Allacma fusca]
MYCACLKNIADELNQVNQIHNVLNFRGKLEFPGNELFFQTEYSKVGTIQGSIQAYLIVEKLVSKYVKHFGVAIFRQIVQMLAQRISLEPLGISCLGYFTVDKRLMTGLKIGVFPVTAQKKSKNDIGLT